MSSLPPEARRFSRMVRREMWLARFKRNPESWGRWLARGLLAFAVLYLLTHVLIALANGRIL